MERLDSEGKGEVRLQRELSFFAEGTCGRIVGAAKPFRSKGLSQKYRHAEFISASTLLVVYEIPKQVLK